MGFFNSLFGNLAQEAVKPIDAIGNVFDKLFTSDDERAQAQIVLEKLKQYPAELQVELNKIEAQHNSVLVAGWRPFIGWICGISMGFVFIPQAIMANYLWLEICLKTGQLQPFPTISGLFDLVVAILGLGIYRTAEKISARTK